MPEPLIRREDFDKLGRGSLVFVTRDKSDPLEAVLKVGYVSSVQLSRNAVEVAGVGRYHPSTHKLRDQKAWMFSAGDGRELLNQIDEAITRNEKEITELQGKNAALRQRQTELTLAVIDTR